MNNWSDNELIKNKGLSHTSMSMGDVIEDVEASSFHVVDACGFCKLTEG